MSTQQIIESWENGREPYKTRKKPRCRKHKPVYSVFECLMIANGIKPKKQRAEPLARVADRFYALSIPKSRQRL